MTYKEFKNYKNKIIYNRKNNITSSKLFSQNNSGSFLIFWKSKKHDWDKFCHNHFTIYKLALAAIFLVLSVSFSLIEIPSIYLPWGAEFDYRIFDSLFLLIAIRMIGLSYALIDAALLPWLHVMIDGEHSVISMLGFMASNMVLVFVFWLLYYKLFRLGYSENQSNSKFFLSSKILFFVFMGILGASIEAASYIFVFKLSMLGILFKGKGDDTPTHTSGNTIGLNSFFHGITILYVFLFLIAAFSVKYIIEFVLFFTLEKRMCKIANHYSVFDKTLLFAQKKSCDKPNKTF